ncbi:MAG: BspA family leucine-rich repeat surface protein [Bacteroidales bacterium]|nr:BspA family leucine-rich repeat surface protein [Bacteroidales bacterium]MCM1415878.1 BspA family leucine-rich repeat surface protein [bacterium]MCM1422692.1 BspA family leucine-rich repeat surface protein [bacterium]
MKLGKMGKRIIAGILVNIMAVSSAFVPADTVRAEEIAPQEIEEVVAADDGTDVPEEEIADDGQEEAGGAENETADRSEEEAKEENTEAEDREENSVSEETGEETEEISQDEELTETVEADDKADEAEAADVSPLADADNIVESGIIDEEYGHIVWTIDRNYKLTVTGTGDFAPVGGGDGRTPWYDYRGSIESAEINVQGMKDASYMFEGCSYLTSVDLHHFDTKDIVNMRFMFSGCESLTSLDLGDFHTEKVTKMNGMFCGCNSLKSLDLGSFHTENVTRMNEMFYECRSLTSLDLSSFNTENVINIDNMFGECRSLVRLDLSSFDLGNLVEVDNDGMKPFYACISLTTVYTPRNLKKEISLPNVHWYRSDGSTLKNLPLNMGESVVINRNKIHEEDVVGGSFRDIIWFIDTERKLTVQGTGEFASDNNNANRGPWWDYRNDFDFAEVDVTGMTNASGMFGGCDELKGVDFSKFDTSQVTDMGSMFSGCSGLTALNLSSLDTSQVIDMRNMFSGCYNLTTLDLSSFETGQVTDIRNMFSGCDNLTTLDLSSFDLSSLKHEDAFEWGSGEQLGLCEAYSLSTIYTPRNIPAFVHISLPSGTWYQPDGTEITELPHLDHSILITRDSIPSVAEPYVKVTKRKTAYQCGESLDLSDLTVRYYDGDGKVTVVSDYGTNADRIDMSTPGTKLLEVAYNGLTAAVELTVSGTVTGKEKVEISGLAVHDSIYSGRAVTYEGTASVKTAAGEDVTAKTTLTYTYSGTMADGSSYPASADAPVDAGKYTLTIAVSQDDSAYTGSAAYSFTIRPAQVTVTALDVVYVIGEGKVLPDSFAFEITGLLNGDLLVKQPVFTLTDTNGKEIAKSDINLEQEGSYAIVAAGADAGMNYEITYRKGILSITEERVAYTVRFEVNGYTDEIPPITGVKAGSLINAPKEPKADGYLFKGWYKDPACSKAWNFDTDIVQEDTVLYARWLAAASADEQGVSLCIQEIKDQSYTGNALKPAISVYSGDGETLLKAGKDYTIKYYNNVEADTAEEEELGGVSATGGEGDNRFTKKLAYLVITGKGNYAGTVYKNFHISPASISARDGEGNLTAAPGFQLKYTEQMTVNASKEQKPFTSLKYKKAMKAGRDYEVAIRVLEAVDGTGNALEKDSMIAKSHENGALPAIPKGCQGTFLMTVTGLGNYTGSIEKTIYVADKTYLLKNAGVSLGKNQKNVKNRTAAELQKGITLTPAYYDASTKKYYAVDENGVVSADAEPDGSNVFTVKAGKTYLVYGKDYTVSYSNNRAVGTAVMTITGIGKYAGTKDIRFKIAGTAFQAKNIIVDSTSLQTAVPYHGKAWTQNKVILYPKGGSTADALAYGVDYTISYKNNVNKGTATMIFTAKPDSGYSGSFKKTFRITQAEISDLAVVTDAVSAAEHGTSNVTYSSNGEIRLETPVPYTKMGVKPGASIRLVNQENGAVLREGKDYKVSYRNHNAVTVGKTVSTDKKPVMVIAGKGNYKGTLSVSFEIGSGVVSLEDIIVPAMPLNTKSHFWYKPKIKVMDGKKALRADQDYTIAYQNNDQENVTRYINGEAGALMPEAVICVPQGSSYRLAGAAGEPVSEISVPLQLYSRTLKKSELYVVVEEPVYNGSQLKPQGGQVRVYLGNSSGVKAANRSKENQESVLTAQDGPYRLSRLTEGTDYVLSYGANTAAGKNKGSLTITGVFPKYGGSVTVKFTILSREICFFTPNP